MLPQKLPNARVMRFGYRSEWFGPQKVITKKTSVPDVAEFLLTELARLRDVSELEHIGMPPLLTKFFQVPDRPLLFVAHSFGGQIVMQALRRSFENPCEWSNPFESTAGLVFFGTPFRGRHGLKLSDMVKNIKVTHPEYEIWQESMEFSVPENPFLVQTVNRFLETRLPSRPIPIWCFYETLPTPVGKLFQSTDPAIARAEVSLM